MKDEYILILFSASIIFLIIVIAKTASFYKRFSKGTRYICRQMDRADSYEEYRKWRGELRCHYLMLIPFVNGKNVMRLYNRIYHRAEKVKKERKDSLVPLLLPSILGIFICTVCVCGMTWAWYTASVEAPAQKMTAAYYEVTVESVMNGADKIEPTDGVYKLEAGTQYTVTLKAFGSVEKCGGYCLIENTANGAKIYTQTFKPKKSITVQFKPTLSGNYTFSGVWGSLPAGTEYLPAEPVTEPSVDTPIPDDTSEPAPTESTAKPSEPAHGTYTVQSGDTLSGIAAKFNTTADKTAAYNGITDKGDIKAGQVLKIPPEDYVLSETTVPQEASSATLETKPTASPVTTEPET